MGLFKRKDDFEAYETDKTAIFKWAVILISIFLVIAILGWVGYNQYKKSLGYRTNETTNESINQTNPRVGPGEVEVEFEDFNLTVPINPEGVYYYSTKEKIVDEICYINGNERDCRALTNSVCKENECKKEIVTKTECFVNQKKVECPI